MRNAVHIRTTGFYCKACPLVVQNAVGSMPGVADVTAVRSMGLTSILFDPQVVDAESLCARIRAAGFGAEIHCPVADTAAKSQCTASPFKLEDSHHSETP